MRKSCGAKTRKGTPCQCQAMPGKQRCKYHGGMSTGPTTTEGRARISEAQHRRWARSRARMAEPTMPAPNPTITARPTPHLGGMPNASGTY